MMRMLMILASVAIVPDSAVAETVVAARTIPARSIIGPEDLLLRDIEAVGSLNDIELAIGLEARVALYAGRPVRAGDLGPPAVVDRNQIVSLIYHSAGLTISTEGRSLDRASPGDLIRVMNVMSRQTVTARIDENGNAHVAN